MEAAKVEALFALAGKNDNGPEALSAMKKAWKAFEAGGYAIVVRGERMFSRLEVERDFVPRSEIGRSLVLRVQVDAEYVSRADVLRDYIPRTQIPSVYVSRNFHDNEVARIRASPSKRGAAPAARRSVASGGGDGEWVKLRETQYKGWCRACRANIEAGSEAYWMRDENGKSVMRCMDCGEG